MKIHIFNPEHDMAMAANTPLFTAPHAARQLRYDLDFLPALWCDEGDIVLVADKERAQKAFARIRASLSKIGVHITGNALFADDIDASQLLIDGADVWGWDNAIVQKLTDIGVSGALLPTADDIDNVRALSHRRTSARLLQGFPGFEVRECSDYDAVLDAVSSFGGTAVLKMPWSSSGRGLRYIENGSFNPHQEGWTKNVISKQGSVMVEPYYNKVMDFAMEFCARHDVTIGYEGLSLFYTENGQYRGNLLATENFKQNILTHYISKDCLDATKQRLMELASTLLHGYIGKFGIDMMLIRRNDDQVEIHPCVEINLRRTIGHIALSASPTDDDYVKAMRIEFDGARYKLKIVSAGRQNIQDDRC